MVRQLLPFGRGGGAKGCAAAEFIDVVGGDGVFGALRWLGHRLAGSGVPVVSLDGEGVEGGRHDVLGLSLQDDAALPAEVLR